jgi:hypothetical protein
MNLLLVGFSALTVRARTAYHAAHAIAHAASGPLPVRPLRQAQLLFNLLYGQSDQRLANGFFGTQQKARAQADADVEATPGRIAPTVLSSLPTHTHTRARTHAHTNTRARARSQSPAPKSSPARRRCTLARPTQDAHHGRKSSQGSAAPVHVVFGLRNSPRVQGASMLDQMTIDEGAWLAPRL